MANTLARQTPLDLWNAPHRPAMTSGGLRGHGQLRPVRDVLAVPVAAKTVAAALVVGYYVLRIRFDELPGVCAGATGKPS